MLALLHVLDGVVAHGVQFGHVIWTFFIIGCAVEWFRLRGRDPTGTADRLGIMIGLLLWALGWALSS